ncbi:MAG: hypothetical protein ACYCW6_27775 [Candidatus Xenobia bacterium]
MSYRLHQEISVVSALDPIVQSGSGNPTPIVYDALSSSDPGVFYDDCEVVLQLGAVAGSPSAVAITCKVQHSTDNSTWADAKDVDGNTYQIGYQPGGLTQGASTLTAGSQTVRFPVDWKSLNRYRKIVPGVTFTGGTSPAIPLGSNFVFGGSKYNPPG